MIGRLEGSRCFLLFFTCRVVTHDRGHPNRGGRTSISSLSKGQALCRRHVCFLHSAVFRSCPNVMCVCTLLGDGRLPRQASWTRSGGEVCDVGNDATTCRMLRQFGQCMMYRARDASMCSPPCARTQCHLCHVCRISYQFVVHCLANTLPISHVPCLVQLSSMRI